MCANGIWLSMRKMYISNGRRQGRTRRLLQKVQSPLNAPLEIFNRGYAVDSREIM